MPRSGDLRRDENSRLLETVQERRQIAHDPDPASGRAQISKSAVEYSEGGIVERGQTVEIERDIRRSAQSGSLEGVMELGDGREIEIADYRDDEEIWRFVDRDAEGHGPQTTDRRTTTRLLGVHRELLVHGHLGQQGSDQRSFRAMYSGEGHRHDVVADHHFDVDVVAIRSRHEVAGR